MDIKQRKGEAEMAQLDWLVNCLPSLKPMEMVMSFVTSADIDAVLLHLFMVSNPWPRQADGSFTNPVYVVLDKSGVCDVYNITSIVQCLESNLGQKASMYISLVLCMGGNDYLPKFHGITHSKLLDTVLTEGVLQTLFNFNVDEFGRFVSGKIVEEVYIDIMKMLYCPPIYNPAKLTFEQVRQNSIKGLRSKAFSNPQKWMPPWDVLTHIAHLVDWQLAYMLTAGDHADTLPVFGAPSIYAMDNQVADPSEICVIPKAQLEKAFAAARRNDPKKGRHTTPPKDRQEGVKRGADDTPQKGLNKKKMALARRP